MEINNQTKTNKYPQWDAGLSAQNMQLIRQSLPLLDFSAQRQISILLKIIELKNTIRNFQNNTYIPVLETQANTTEKTTSSNANPFNTQTSPFNNFMNTSQTNNSSNNSSNNMLNNMMMLMNMMNNNTSSNLSAADLSSHTQRPPDMNGFISKFKQSMTEEQRNMFNTFNTLMQANSMQERNSVRNDDVQ